MKPRISWPESNSWKTLLQTLSLVNYNSVASIHSRICIVQSISANVTLIIAVIFDQSVAYPSMIGIINCETFKYKCPGGILWYKIWAFNDESCVEIQIQLVLYIKKNMQQSAIYTK